MIKLTRIEEDSIAILIKNLRWEISHRSNNVINYQADIVDITLIIKGLEKSLETP